MSMVTTPQAKDWNNYWGLDQTKQFTKVSWSKRRIIEILSPLCRPGRRALDAGCGSGFFAKYFLDQGMKTTALDYSDQALDIAKQITQGKAQILKKDLLSSNLAHEFNEKYDLIFSDGLLEHFSLDQQNKILTNLRELLSSDGHLVTFVPNRFSPWELIRPFYMPGIDEKPFNLKQLITLHQNNRFEIIQNGGINTFPFAVSPDPLIGKQFGMLLYVVARKI